MLTAINTAQKNRFAATGYKKLTTLLMAGLLCAGLSSHKASASGYNPPYASIVVDANSGKTLQATSADRYRYPASITKVMTLYLLFEALEAGKVSMNTQMVVSTNASKQQPSKLGLRAGSTIRVRDAINALAIKSANDAAVVVAEHLGGSEENFARVMTQRARQLGMNKTTFKNASGLPDERQKTTARNLAILGYSMMTRFPEYATVFKKTSFTFAGKTYRSHNYLLGRVKGVDGIKTGYTRASGFNLLSSRQLGEKRIIAVVLGGKSSKSRNAAMTALVQNYLNKASSRPYKLSHFAGLRLDKSIYDQNNISPTTLALNQSTNPSKQPSTIPQPPIITVASQSRPVIIKTQSKQAADVIVSTQLPPRPVSEITQMAKATSLSEIEEGDAQIENDVITGWSVQIGAVPSESIANDILAQHKPKGGRALAKSVSYTQPVEVSGNTLWRARYGNMSKIEASSACQSLKKNGVSCYVIQ